MDLVTEIRRRFAEGGDPVRAAGQKAYMKSDMDFYGFTTDEMRRIVRAVAKECDPDLAQIDSASRQLFDEATFREERYAAIALTGLKPALGQLSLVPLHEHQALTGAWWDFVDEIAHRIRVLHDTHPEETGRIVRGWSRAESFWLRRLSIISQLQRGHDTDTELLTEVIETNSADKEFFIRKAIGWALRDFARTNPDWVLNYANTHDLSPLSRREALKHIG
ncbi:MAG: DNA alkylation repair protein [Propionibacteriaceae bacterium]|jgi:3-methyladenine DNA glycosylase AlkD|nr:DNA alkylation repair protein [Propionibacteriaceae bacterium]